MADVIVFNPKKLPIMLAVPAKYAQSKARDKRYSDNIEIDFAAVPDISLESSTMLNALLRCFIRSTVKHDVLYATKKVTIVIKIVQFIPSLAAEIGSDIRPDPIAIPETRKTELINLLIIQSSLKKENTKIFNDKKGNVRRLAPSL